MDSGHVNRHCHDSGQPQVEPKRSLHFTAFKFSSLFILCVFSVMHLDPIHFPAPSYLPSALPNKIK